MPGTLNQKDWESQTIKDLQKELKKVLKSLSIFWTPTNLTVTKFQTKRFYHGLILSIDANGIANSEVVDETVPSRNSLIWICTVCQTCLS